MKQVILISMNNLQIRKVKYLGMYEVADWNVKIYRITDNEGVKYFNSTNNLKQEVEKWIKAISAPDLITYKIGTVIFHNWPDGMYAWLLWWNKYDLPNSDFYFRKKGTKNFIPCADKSMIDYIQEFGVVWFERNEWNTHIIYNPSDVNIKGYLQSFYKEPIQR